MSKKSFLKNKYLILNYNLGVLLDYFNSKDAEFIQ